MTRVLYDHQVFSWQKLGGVSRYFVELINHLPAGIECKLPPMLTENVYLGSLGAATPPTRRWTVAGYRVRKQLYERLNQRVSSRMVAKGGYDVFHPTYYSTYFQRRLKAPYVITVHDFIHEKYPQYFSDASRVIRQKREAITRADRIIAISRHTRDDLVDIYGIPASRVDVIYHGASPLTAEPVPVEMPAGKFILFVGDRTKYKNFNNLAEAFALLAREDCGLGLVCAGKPFSDTERSYLDMLGVGGRSMALFATDAELAWLYANTACFVFPSVYEGFGLPILEAWAAGAPVALSRTSCFPEIASSAAAWFEPDNPEDIARSVGEVVYSTETRERLLRLSAERLKMFDWKKTAALTAGIYRSLSAQ